MDTTFYLGVIYYSIKNYIKDKINLIMQNLLKIYFSIIEDRPENMPRICYDFGTFKEAIYYFL